MLMAVGVGLTLINTRAVLEALFGVKSGFVRTPKYAIEGNQQKRMAVKKYKRRSGWLPYFELACGTYFLYMCWFADHDLQLSDAAVPGAVRRRLLLGRLRHALPGISGPAALQPPASLEFETAAVSGTPSPPIWSAKPRSASGRWRAARRC